MTQFRRHILAAGLVLCVQAALPLQAFAQDVCRSARQCADILSRHAPDSFDYGVLASEVARLGQRGESAVKRLAGDPETAANAFALATRAEAPASLKAALLRQWPAPDPELHIALAETFQDPAVRQTALRTLATPQLRDASIRLLATQDRPLRPQIADQAYPPLAAAAVVKPDPVLLDLIAQVPGERGAPILVRALGSGDADAIVTAFAALADLNPARAEADLLAAFRASPPEHAGAWTTVLERAGMTVPSFDAIAFGYAALADLKLAPHQRAVGLHTAMLYPAGEKGRVAGSVEDLLPLLAKLPVSDRLAMTAPSHPAMQTPRAQQTLLGLWQGRDSEAVAEFVRALGRAQPSNSRALLRGIYGRTSDYRVQVAVIDALDAIGQEDDEWIASVTRGHPIRLVQVVGMRAAGQIPGEPLPACRPAAPRLELEAKRMPFFQSGLYANGTPAKRWQLKDARPIPGGWLAGYTRGLIRYASEDSSEATPITGHVVAVLPDTRPVLGERARVFWVVERGERVARLHRYDVDAAPDAALPAPSTLPRDVRVVKLGEEASERFKGRGWGLAFGGDQATLVVTRDGRIVPICAELKPHPYAPPRL